MQTYLELVVFKLQTRAVKQSRTLPIMASTLKIHVAYLVISMFVIDKCHNSVIFHTQREIIMNFN